MIAALHPVALSRMRTHCVQAADWVAARAVAIDRASGQVGHAAELLAHGGASDQTGNVQQLQSVLSKGVHTELAP